MKKILAACGIALLMGAPAEAHIPGRTSDSFDLTCARVRMTAYVPNFVSQEPFACCADGRVCPRYLSTTPVPRPHHDLKT